MGCGLPEQCVRLHKTWSSPQDRIRSWGELQEHLCYMRMQRSRGKDKKQSHICSTENILSKDCTTEGVQNYDQKSFGRFNSDAVPYVLEFQISVVAEEDMRNAKGLSDGEEFQAALVSSLPYDFVPLMCGCFCNFSLLLLHHNSQLWFFRLHTAVWFWVVSVPRMTPRSLSAVQRNTLYISILYNITFN